MLTLISQTSRRNTLKDNYRLKTDVKTSQELGILKDVNIKVTIVGNKAFLKIYKIHSSGDTSNAVPASGGGFHFNKNYFGNTLRKFFKVKYAGVTYYQLVKRGPDYYEIVLIGRELNKSETKSDVKEVNHNLTFGQAIEAAKRGKVITRSGWNGKGMSVCYVPGKNVSYDYLMKSSIKNAILLRNKSEGNHNNTPSTRYSNPYFVMIAADGSIVNGWLASQTDMSATDWMIL